MSEIEKQEPPTDRPRAAGSSAKRLLEQHITASYQWIAPLPPPEVLARYNDAFPGCAERVVSMAEQQSAHRVAMEKQVVGGHVYSQKTGMWLAFVLALIAMSSGPFLVHEGRIGWGAGFVGIPLVALVSIFVSGRGAQKRDLKHGKSDSSPQRNLPFPD